MVFAIILLLLLGLSGLMNLGFFIGAATPRSFEVGPRLDEATLEDNSSANKIAVIEISGIIAGRDMERRGYSMVDVVKAQLKRAEKDKKNVKAVILKVDSPGGEVLASDEIYHAIEDFQKDTKMPVVASMGSLAASGGYYVSAPCRWIVANELTITGSIGVIMHTWNYRGLMDKVGLLPEVYKSGKYKDMLSGERDPKDITPEERDMVQSLINETYAKFKKVVQDGRDQSHDQNLKNKNAKDKGRVLVSNWTDYADGRILSGTEAYDKGFVDQLGNFQTAVDRAQNLAGISDANLIAYQQRRDLGDILGLLGKSEAPVVKVDIGLEPPHLLAGHLYFLSPSFVH